MFDMNYKKCKAQTREAKYQRLRAITTNWLNAKNAAEFKIASDINGPRLTLFEKMSLGCYQFKMAHPIIWGALPILFIITSVMMALINHPMFIWFGVIVVAIHLAIETIFIDSSLIETIQCLEQEYA